MKHLILLWFCLSHITATSQIYDSKTFCNETPIGVIKTNKRYVTEIEHQCIHDILFIAAYDLLTDKRMYEEQEWTYTISNDCGKDGMSIGLHLISKKYTDLRCWCYF